MSEALDGIKARVGWTKQVPAVAAGVVQLCDYIAALEELVIPITHSLTKVSDKATAAVEKLAQIGRITTATLEAQATRIEVLEELLKEVEDRSIKNTTRHVKAAKRFIKLEARIAAIEERNEAIDLMQLEAMQGG